jgi:DNA-binding GntR family transcriptional regulator
MPDESVPPYLRIANDIEADITSGRLVPGDRVPSLARLAQEYGVAKNTVIKAIDVLKGKGLIVSRQGWGNFISS